MSKIVDVDFLILGSGIAGLYCAYQLAEFGEVLLITKAEVDDANTTWAQGGIAVRVVGGAAVGVGGRGQVVGHRAMLITARPLHSRGAIAIDEGIGRRPASWKAWHARWRRAPTLVTSGVPR